MSRRDAVARRALLRTALALPALAGARALPAAEPQVDGPRARFDDDLIARLEGRWRLTRQIRGTEVQNTVSAGWVLNHQFMRLHMKDMRDPPAYEAIVLIGYVHASAEYVAHWTDPYGGKFSAVGRARRDGNSIPFRFDYPDGPFFNTFTWEPDTGRWVFRLESQDADGRRRPFATDTLVREP